jgi:hypothetical protein
LRNSTAAILLLREIEKNVCSHHSNETNLLNVLNTQKIGNIVKNGAMPLKTIATKSRFKLKVE